MPDSVADDAEAAWRRDPDVRLMLAVRDDQPGAFEQLLARYQDRLVGVLAHLVGNVQEAEDLAQTAFLRVYRNRKTYEPKAKFSTWLFMIARNLAANARRDARLRPASEAAAGAVSASGASPLERLAAAPSGASPSRLLAKAELSEVVRVAVEQLPEDQRLAVLLNKFEDMSYRDIAAVLGKSEMAVKSLLARARTALKSALEPYLAEGQRPTAP